MWLVPTVDFCAYGLRRRPDLGRLRKRKNKRRTLGSFTQRSHSGTDWSGWCIVDHVEPLRSAQYDP
ncbi:hypothetical protein E2C01_047563 [Portunus trituberculatus]|uniref:Uncharacterized protein n=1 Tax=Portunus trituberculatus TaxID=210409 RepID=A0A5B7G898_PORTR|nr:hypothetical protein [Portunus trituberculatus]